MEAVDHKIQNAKYEHRPYRIQKSLTAQITLVQISNYITYPGKRCKEHENEIKNRIRIDKRMKHRDLVMLIQKSPGYICYKIACHRNEEMPVEKCFFKPFFISSVLNPDLLKSPSVYYKMEDKRQNANDRIMHGYLHSLKHITSITACDVFARYILPYLVRCNHNYKKYCLLLYCLFAWYLQ